MQHRLIAVLLMTAMTLLCSAPSVSAADRADREAVKRAEQATEVKKDLDTLGTGPDAQVDLRRRDGTRLKGYVSELSDESFEVTDASGAVIQVPYEDVRKIKGHNLATGWKIAIGVGAAIALALVLVWSGAIGDFER